MNVNVVELK